ncbi:hypothetical protein MSG28_003100 [Choristoneura fumiferana]|uniref:Uncharacterized protein n=1 Tax=Choristoneura fumiferana TaxID=7141 RepID=A0ACC0KDI8_CHOFU|nr:hypothetical protein MSG28_003100 [Choristoneura fumiferana]
MYQAKVLKTPLLWSGVSKDRYINYAPKAFVQWKFQRRILQNNLISAETSSGVERIFSWGNQESEKRCYGDTPYFNFGSLLQQKAPCGLANLNNWILFLRRIYLARLLNASVVDPSF